MTVREQPETKITGRRRYDRTVKKGEGEDILSRMSEQEIPHAATAAPPTAVCHCCSAEEDEGMKEIVFLLGRESKLSRFSPTMRKQLLSFLREWEKECTKRNPVPQRLCVGLCSHCSIQFGTVLFVSEIGPAVSFSSLPPTSSFCININIEGRGDDIERFTIGSITWKIHDIERSNISVIKVEGWNNRNGNESRDGCVGFSR